MHIATCFPVSSTDKAAISTIAPRTHIDRRDVESGKCNASSRLSKHRTSSLRTRSSTATSTHADTKWLPETTEPYGRRHSMRGGRTHAPGARHDYASRRTTGSALPSQVNVTMPAREYDGVVEAAKRLIRSYPDCPMIYCWPAALSDSSVVMMKQRDGHPSPPSD